MRQQDESRTDLGNIRIHKNVIASVSAIAATEIEGVKRIRRDFKSGVMELLGNKALSNIKVDIDKNGEVKIELPVVIKYGYNIPDVSARVQENVHAVLEKMTHLSIKDININVQAIEK